MKEKDDSRRDRLMLLQRGRQPWGRWVCFVWSHSAAGFGSELFSLQCNKEIVVTLTNMMSPHVFVVAILLICHTGPVSWNSKATGAGGNVVVCNAKIAIFFRVNSDIGSLWQKAETHSGFNDTSFEEWYQPPALNGWCEISHPSLRSHDKKYVKMAVTFWWWSWTADTTTLICSLHSLSHYQKAKLRFDERRNGRTQSSAVF